MKQIINSNRSWAGVATAILAILIVAPMALANPAMQLTETITQPDGTRFDARLWGDEFANGWETADGYTIRFDSRTGYWVYAVLDETGGLTESTARAGIDPPVERQHLRPTSEWMEPRYLEMGSNLSLDKSLDKAAPGWASGNTEVLIIMVQFPADGGDPDGAQPAVGASFTSAQATANMFGGTSTGPGNLTDYYDEISFGALNLIGTIVGPYTVAHDKNDYDDGPRNAKDMVAEAIALADGDVDFNDFDNDGDGWVDNVAVMYAGNGPDNGRYDGADPNTNRLWPHASSLGAAVAVDGINAKAYYIAPELLNSNPRLRTIGVYAHEFGHKLGLPDLYDTDDATGPNYSEGIGHWCLMSTGSWCSDTPGFENGESPSHMSAWCKQYMGWMTPTDMTGVAGGLSIPQAETNAYAVQLGANPGGPDDWPGGSGEYFLIENRQQTMFDVGLDGCGILIWHIDESLTTNRNQGHTAGVHRLVDLEEADGLDELDNVGDRGDAGDPYPGSANTTVWDDVSFPHSQLYDGTSTNYEMTVVSACGATMDVTFLNSPPVAICQDVEVEADGDCQADADIDNGSYDPDGDDIVIEYSPAGPYELGETEVTLTITDEFGESDSCTGTVTVIDATPPMVTCPGHIEIECTEPGGVSATDAQLTDFFADFMAEDNCDDDLDIVNDAPAFFTGPCEGSGGATEVTWRATDDAGNFTECSATVTVVDTTPPELEVTVSPQVLWPPNHKMVDVEYTVTVSDVCDDSPVWELVDLTSNEPEDDLGDGTTEPDIMDADLGTADTSVSLRAERQGVATGRIYTATFSATDCSGNTAMTYANVYVPHSKSDIGTILSSSSPARASRGEITFMISGASLWRKKIPAEYIGGDVEGGSLGTVNPLSAVITNTAGLVPTSAFFVKDVDGDDHPDVLVAFPQRELVTLEYESAVEDGAPVMVLEIAEEKFMVLEMNNIEDIDLDLDLIIGKLRSEEDEGDERGLDRDDNVVVAATRATGITGTAPNPFNPKTTVSFYVPKAGHVDLAVYDISGRMIKRLVDDNVGAGDHSVAWLGDDSRGSRVASGVYFFRMSAGGVVDTKRAVMIK